MESEETYNLTFTTPPVAFQRYGFGSNYTIQTRQTKRIIIYPYFGVPSLNMVPVTTNIANQLFNPLPYFLFNVVLISIALRSGGFLFIDYPLTSLAVTDQIHAAIELNADIDFNNSYIRFTSTAILPTNPFLIAFGFRLHDKAAHVLRKLV